MNEVVAKKGYMSFRIPFDKPIILENCTVTKFEKMINCKILFKGLFIFLQIFLPLYF